MAVVGITSLHGCSDSLRGLFDIGDLSFSKGGSEKADDMVSKAWTDFGRVRNPFSESAILWILFP